jgi:hypothetical protein
MGCRRSEEDPNSGEKQIPNNLLMTLEPLWYGMKQLAIYLIEKQKILI